MAVIMPGRLMAGLVAAMLEPGATGASGERGTREGFSVRRGLGHAFG